MALAPSRTAKELNASDAVALLERIEPATPVERARHDLAVELLGDVQRLDAQLKESHRRIRIAVKASGTTLTDLFGVGPIIACYLVGFTATSAASPAGTSAPPTTARHPSSAPQAAVSCIDSPSAATDG
jgi:transposase